MVCSENELPSENERLQFRVIIYRNVIKSAQRLLKGMEELEIPFESALPDGTVETITALDAEKMSNIKPMLILMIGSLWKDDGVQTCMGRIGELGLGDSTK
jgi:hypothetical protein